MSAQFIEKTLQTKSTDWATLLTDIIAASAALGALALPLSLNVIEATRSRYRSPTLLSLYSKISKTDAQKINRLLFATLVFTLLLKLALLSNITDFGNLIPPIFGLVFFFAALVSDLFKHLQFTYKLMSNVNLIKNNLIRQLGDVLPEPKQDGRWYSRWYKGHLKGVWSGFGYHRDMVFAIFELETYDICSGSGKREMDIDLIKILNSQINNLESEVSQNFVQDALAAFPRMLSEVETSREVDIYTNCAGLYLHILAKAFLKSSQFAHHLDEAVRISRFRERSLPPQNQLCSNGTIFISCMLEKPNEVTYKLILEHFRNLLWNALHSAPENVPEILINADNIFYGAGYDDDVVYFFQQRIEGGWTYPILGEISKEVERCQSGELQVSELEGKLRDGYRQQIISAFDAGSPGVDLVKLASEIDESIDVVLSHLRSKAIIEEIEVETLHAMGLLLEKSPESVIKCREHKNPAGAAEFNIGRPLVPSSINACVAALVRDKYYKYRTPRNGVLEFKIVDAVGVLIVYELWKDFIVSSIKVSRDDYIGSIQLPDCTIRELKEAESRIDVLERSLKKIVSNKDVTQSLKLLDADIDVISDVCADLCKALKARLSARVDEQTANQSLDVKQIERFKAEILEDWRGVYGGLPLLKNFRVSRCKPFTFKLKKPRYAFLANTGVHFVFGGVGRDTLIRYHNHLAYMVMKSKSLSAETSWPLPVGEVILLTYSALKKLESYGFLRRSGQLIWPNKLNQKNMYLVGDEPALYYQLLEGQRIIDVSFDEVIDGFPFSISHKDGREEVETSLTYHFSLSEKFLSDGL